jgi:hypothetical protein
VAFAGTAGWCVRIASQIARFALKTGGLVRRGGYASRRDRPIHYWGGLLFWTGLGAIVVFPAASLGWMAMR